MLNDPFLAGAEKITERIWCGETVPVDSERITETDIENNERHEVSCVECGMRDYAAMMQLDPFAVDDETPDYLCSLCVSMFIAETEETFYAILREERAMRG